MAHIKRYLFDKIINNLAKRKIIIIYGARQVGKTTLVKEVMQLYPKSVYLSGDFVEDQARLSESSRAMVDQFANKDLLVIDEAQRIPNIGLKLKSIFDTLPTLKIIVTGSSALEISHKVSESLTGRFIAHVMYPISLTEALTSKYFNLEHALIYGTYPEVVISKQTEDKQSIITNIDDLHGVGDLTVFSFENLQDILK